MDIQDQPLLNFPPPNEIQRDAIESFMRSETKHASIVAPVGIGKTLIALQIWDRLGNPNVLIVVPRIVLIQNPWLKEMERVGIRPETVGRYYSELKEVRHPVTVTLYDSLSNYPELMKSFDLVIFDEEQFLSKGHEELLDIVGETRYVLGMTGTLPQAEGKFEKLVSVLPPIFEASIAEAREKRMLAPAEIIPVYVDLPEPEMESYRRMYSLYDVIRRRAFARRNRAELRQANVIKQRIDQILSSTPEKLDRAVEIIASDPKVPTLVFSLSLKSIETLQAKLDEKGIESRTITHEMHDRAERQRIVNGFGVEYPVLMSVGTLEVGFNVPNASREILIANAGGLERTEQRLGRVLRLDPHNPDKIAKVYVEIANGTIDETTLKYVKRAYNRLKRSSKTNRNG